MIDFIKELALQAGKKSLEYFGNLKSGDVSGKSTEKDLVSIADKAVEDFIICEIKKNFPTTEYSVKKQDAATQTLRTAGSLIRSTEPRTLSEHIRFTVYPSRFSTKVLRLPDVFAPLLSTDYSLQKKEKELSMEIKGYMLPNAKRPKPHAEQPALQIFV